MNGNPSSTSLTGRKLTVSSTLSAGDNGVKINAPTIRVAEPVSSFISSLQKMAIQDGNVKGVFSTPATGNTFSDNLGWKALSCSDIENTNNDTYHCNDALILTNATNNTNSYQGNEECCSDSMKANSSDFIACVKAKWGENSPQYKCTQSPSQCVEALYNNSNFPTRGYYPRYCVHNTNGGYPGVWNISHQNICADCAERSPELATFFVNNSFYYACLNSFPDDCTTGDGEYSSSCSVNCYKWVNGQTCYYEADPSEAFPDGKKYGYINKDCNDDPKICEDKTTCEAVWYEWQKSSSSVYALQNTVCDDYYAGSCYVWGSLTNKNKPAFCKHEGDIAFGYQDHMCGLANCGESTTNQSSCCYWEKYECVKRTYESKSGFFLQ